MPSHMHTPPTMAFSCSGESVPSSRIKRTAGTVTIPCASKAPLFRNRTEAATSNRVPRRLVVCGTTVTRARSSAPGTPRIAQGRIFAARPRSTSQTSPRRGGLTPEPRVCRSPETRHLLRRSAPHLKAWSTASVWSDARAELALHAFPAQEALQKSQAIVSRRLS